MFRYALVLWSVLSVAVTSTDDTSRAPRAVNGVGYSIRQSDEHEYPCKVMATSPKSGEKIPYTRIISAPDVEKARSDFRIKAEVWALKLHYSLDMSTLSCGSGGNT